MAAPITAGQEIAHLVLEREGMPEMRLPLVAEADVPRGGFVPRVTTAFGVLLGKAGLTALPAMPVLGGGEAEGQDAEGEGLQAGE